MGEIINKISFNGNLYDITIPHGTVSALQGGTNYNVVQVSSLPAVGQMIAITFPVELITPVVVFQTDNVETEVSTPMAIMYKGRGILADRIIPYSTYSFIVTQDAVSGRLNLTLIGDFDTDTSLGFHASASTSYGVATISTYGHVKTVTGDLSTITSHTDGHAAAAYHSHSNYITTSQLPDKLNSLNYNKTFYLSLATSSEEIEADERNGINIHHISFDAGVGISHELENGDMLIFPLSVRMSYGYGGDYYMLSKFTILTPSGECVFTFSDPHKNKFYGVSSSNYKLICVVENDTYLRVLNPVETMMSWNAYTATTANYASTATTANYASTSTTANYATTAGNASRATLAAAASYMQTTRYIDGLAFNGSTNVSHYGVCTAAGNTAIKRVSIPGLTAVTGAVARVKFTNAHTVTTTTTATRARLVLNNATYSGTRTTGIIRAFSTGFYLLAGNSWAAGQIVEMIYDGTYWNIISPYVKTNGVLVNPGTPGGDLT